MASKTQFPVTERDILHSNTTRYLIVNFNGEGCFGKVAKCLDLIKGKMVAVKIHKKSGSRSIRDELEMLSAIRNIDPDKNNIVKFMEYFRFNNLSCLAFEMLDKSLWDLMKERKWKGLSLKQIRPVTQQLLVAFKALKENGIMHTDLKPDNVMLVNHQNQPFKIKLIDFGLALPVNHAEVGMLMQACAYRAPEVTLGLPLSESVDMWGVGCIMAFLYFGVNLFPGDCAYHRMKLMLQLLGEPDDRLLDIGQYSKFYFTMAQNSSWRLRTPEEYAEITGQKPSTDRWYFECNRTLDYIVRSYEKKSVFEFKDRVAFSDLMISCLHPNHDDRITPRDALKHEFVTMAHLVDSNGSETYMDTALKFTAFTQHSYESEDDWRSFPSLSSGEVQTTGCSSTDNDHSSGNDARLDEDGNEEHCPPVKYYCGQTYNKPKDEKKVYPEHLDQPEEDCSYKKSDPTGFSLSAREIQKMESSTTDTDSCSGTHANFDRAPVKYGCGQTYTKPENEKEVYPEHLDQPKDEESDPPSFSLLAREIQKMESSTTDTNSCSGTDLNFNCAPVKYGCGQTYTKTEDDKEVYPEHLDQPEEDCSYEESDPPSFSPSAREIQKMESSTADTDSCSGPHANFDCAPVKYVCGQTYTKPENEKEVYPEHLDQPKEDCSYEESDPPSSSPSVGEIQKMESSTTDTDSCSGIDASFDCAPVKCGCGQPYSGPEDEKEVYPEHLDQSEEDCSYEESDPPSSSPSAGEIQLLESSTTDTDSCSGIDASLDEDAKESENEGQRAPMRCGCGQLYTSNHASFPSSHGNNDINANKSHGPVEDQQASTDLYNGVRDTATPHRKDPGTTACHNNMHVNYLPVGRNNRPSSDIVPNGGAAASFSSNHGNTTSLLSNNGTPVPVGFEETDNIETAPVTVRRKTIRQRIGRFFRRVRKLFHY